MSETKIVAQKIIHKYRLFEIAQNTIKLPNDKENVYEDIYVQPSVFIFPLTAKNEIYLIYEYRYLLNKRVLSAVAGFCEKGETSIQSAKRELAEEAGLVASHWEEVLRVETENSLVKSRKHLFLARELEKVERSLEEGEDIELVKMPLKEAVKKVFKGEISGAGTMIGILLLDRLRREKKI